MKVITLLNEKGGVGKTTLAVHLAAGLAIRGQRVVLVDADAQGNATIAFGLAKEPGFYDLIVRHAPYQDVMRLIPQDRYAPQDSIVRELMLIPSNLETRSISTNISDAFAVLKRLLELRETVDTVIIDTSPTPSLLHSSIYMATDALLYPTLLEKWSFDGLRESIAHREQFQPIRQQYQLPDIQFLGIVPTMTRLRTLEHRDNLAYLTESFPGQVYDPIPLRTIWTEATSARKTVFTLAPGSKTVRDAWDFVDRVQESLYAKTRMGG